MKLVGGRLRTSSNVFRVNTRPAVRSAPQVKSSTFIMWKQWNNTFLDDDDVAVRGERLMHVHNDGKGTYSWTGEQLVEDILLCDGWMMIEGLSSAGNLFSILTEDFNQIVKLGMRINCSLFYHRWAPRRGTRGARPPSMWRCTRRPLSSRRCQSRQVREKEEG